MRRSQSGFTLIELMIVISIIGVLAAVLLPRVLESREQAYASSDQAQLRTHYMWLESYKAKNDNFLPSKGGHKFVMTTWTSGVVEHTPENLDKYFTPGQQDPYWREVRGLMEREEDPWPDLNSVTTEDTHYCGRSKKHLRTSTSSAKEAWMANDNEGVWCLTDGTVNILMNGGQVRTYSYIKMMDLFDLGPLDKSSPIETYGPNSPIPECQKLDN